MLPFELKLPPVVKPEQAYQLDEQKTLDASKLVARINSELKNLPRGSKKRVTIYTSDRNPIYQIVLRHFRAAWNVREVDPFPPDPRDMDDAGGCYWEFSEPGQLDR